MNYFDKRLSTKNENAESSQNLIQLNYSDASEVSLLHEIIDDYFNEQELRTLCFHLGIDYDDLPFSGQSNKARELVSLFSRSNKLEDLQEAVRKAKPRLFENVDGSDT